MDKQHDISCLHTYIIVLRFFDIVTFIARQKYTFQIQLQNLM